MFILILRSSGMCLMCTLSQKASAKENIREDSCFESSVRQWGVLNALWIGLGKWSHCLITPLSPVLCSWWLVQWSAFTLSDLLEQFVTFPQQKRMWAEYMVKDHCKVLKIRIVMYESPAPAAFWCWVNKSWWRDVCFTYLLLIDKAIKTKLVHYFFEALLMQYVIDWFKSISMALLQYGTDELNVYHYEVAV